MKKIISMLLVLSIVITTLMSAMVVDVSAGVNIPAPNTTTTPRTWNLYYNSGSDSRQIMATGKYALIPETVAEGGQDSYELGTISSVNVIGMDSYHFEFNGLTFKNGTVGNDYSYTRFQTIYSDASASAIQPSTTNRFGTQSGSLAMKNSAANAASSVIGGDGTNANGKVLRYTFYAYTTAETAQDLYVQLNGNSSGVQSFIMSAADLYSPDSIPHKIDLYVWSDSKDKVVFGSTDTNTSEYVYLAAVMDGNRFIKCARRAEKNNSAMKATSGNLYPTIFYLLQQKKDTTEFTVTATDAYIMHPNAEKGWEQIDRANVCDNLFKNINIGASGTTTLTTTDKEGFVTGFGEYTTAMETALASVGAGESASIEIFERDYNAPASIYDNYDSSNVKVVDSYGKVLTAAEVASLTSLDNHYFVINGVYVNI